MVVMGLLYDDHRSAKSAGLPQLQPDRTLILGPANMRVFPRCVDGGWRRTMTAPVHTRRNHAPLSDRTRAAERRETERRGAADHRQAVQPCTGRHVGAGAVGAE